MNIVLVIGVKNWSLFVFLIFGIGTCYSGLVQIKKNKYRYKVCYFISISFLFFWVTCLLKILAVDFKNIFTENTVAISKDDFTLKIRAFVRVFFADFIIHCIFISRIKLKRRLDVKISYLQTKHFCIISEFFCIK